MDDAARNDHDTDDVTHGERGDDLGTQRVSLDALLGDDDADLDGPGPGGGRPGGEDAETTAKVVDVGTQRADLAALTEGPDDTADTTDPRPGRRTDPDVGTQAVAPVFTVGVDPDDRTDRVETQLSHKHKTQPTRRSV